MSSKIICEFEQLGNRDLRLEIQSFYFPQQGHLRRPVSQLENLDSVDIFRQSDRDTTIIAGSIGSGFPAMKIISALSGRNTVWTFRAPICNQISFSRENGETIEKISVNFTELTFEIIAPIGGNEDSQTKRKKTSDRNTKALWDYLRG